MKKEPKIDEIENEAKSLLSLKDYEMLLRHFKDDSGEEFLLKNHYFDTLIGMKISRDLPPGTTLRIRESLAGDALQLKLPIRKGVCNEYKDDLDINSKSILFSEGIIPLGNVREKLKELGIMELYSCIGSVATYRVQVETEWTSAKVFFDRVVYPDGFVDYEIEIESASIYYSENILFDILRIFSIEKIEATSKFERFLEHI